MTEIGKKQIAQEFESTKERVLFILENDKESRNSDIRLLCKYLEQFTPFRLINLNEIFPVLRTLEEAFSQNHLIKKAKTCLKVLEFKLSKIPYLTGFPSSETIRRVRQKIQNEKELFIPTIEEIARKRNIRAELIREYFIEQKKIEG